MSPTTEAKTGKNETVSLACSPESSVCTNSERRIRRVLVVEDHLILRTIISDMLMATFPPCRVDMADTGQEAIRKAVLFEPDVILMDVRLPDMDGIEATREILTRWRAARVIVWTSYADFSLRAAAFAAGARAFLLKSGDPSELIGAFGRFL
jgi:two-component system, NarL family, response regulator LiaR